MGLMLVAVAARPLAAWMQRREVRHAQGSFHAQRDSLQAHFLELASRGGKPRGLIWKKCDWQPAVRFARDRQSRQLTALAGVEIHFEAVAGGDMEDVAAVGTIRDASAVFHYHDGAWGTGGRALFNMNPDGAMERLSAQFEAVDSHTRNSTSVT